MSNVPGASRCAALFLGALALQPSPVLARDWRLEASLGARGAFLPSGFLDRFFEVHGQIQGFGPVVELGWTRERFHALAVCELAVITTADQIWLEQDHEAKDAKWIEVDARLLSYGLIFAYEIPLFGPLSLEPTLGFVPLNLQGDLMQYPTDGAPGTPVEERTRAVDFPGKPLKLPSQFKGSDLGLRLRVQPAERWFLSADFGWRMVLYAGLQSGVSF